MITYEVTTNRNCNLQCYFCFANSNKEQSCNVLKLEDFKRGLEDSLKLCNIKNEDFLFIKFYGGETLLYTDRFIEYLDAIKDSCNINKHMRINVVLVSNGTIIKDILLDKINSLKEVKNMHFNITFSMESNKTTHDSIRIMKNGDPTFDLVINNVIKYRNITGKIPHVQAVLSPDLLRNPQDYINFMEKYKDMFEFDLVPMFDDTFENIPDEELVLNNIRVIIDYYIEKFEKNDYKHLSIFQPFRSIVNRFLKNAPVKSHCEAGCGTLSITPDGTYVPCSRYVYNNINISFKDIDDYISKEDKFRVLARHDYECRKCQIENDFGCLGKCSAISIRNGSPNFKYASICRFNIRFGKECNRLFEKIAHSEGLKDRFKRFKYNKNILSEMEEYILNGGKDE